MKLGILMDPIDGIQIHKDSSFAMLLEAQKRGHHIDYFEPTNLFIEDGIVFGCGKSLQVADKPAHWFDFLDTHTTRLSDLDVLLIRNDPPFDSHYLHLTHLLELAEKDGLLIVNRPAAIRDYNEKLAINWFPSFMPPTLVSMQMPPLKEFLDKHQTIILKPLSDMGGSSIFMLQSGDKNTQVILETITNNGQKLIMAQRYIPAINHGDKRILLIDGVPVDYALARIPAEGEFRGNLAKGATGKGVALTAHDLRICQAIGPVLKQKGLLFVGLDVIGDFITEINVTSPTCIRELDRQFGLNIAGQLFDAIEAKL